MDRLPNEALTADGMVLIVDALIGKTSGGAL